MNRNIPIKICPVMSGPDRDVADDGKVECIKHQCVFWITVYTTETHTTQGCAHALQPQMHEGLLRV